MLLYTEAKTKSENSSSLAFRSHFHITVHYHRPSNTMGATPKTQCPPRNYVPPRSNIISHVEKRDAPYTQRSYVRKHAPILPKIQPRGRGQKQIIKPSRSHRPSIDTRQALLVVVIVVLQSLQGRDLVLEPMPSASLS